MSTQNVVVWCGREGGGGGGGKVNHGHCESGQYLTDLVFTESHAITNVY